MEVEDYIIELTPKFWPKLRDKFKRNWPEHQIGYLLVDDYIKWVEKDTELNYIKNVKFYILNGDFSDGTFVVVDRYQLFIYTLDETNERLLKLLRLLDWSKGLIVSSFRKKFKPVVLSVMKEFEVEIEFVSETFVHFLPKEKASKLSVDITNGYKLKSMSTWDHAKTANDIWPYKHEGSLYYFKRLIDLNPNIGVFDAHTGELIAWCFRYQSGPLGALQVKEQFYRQGFGTLAVRAMCKLLSIMEQDIIALIADTNTASKATFKALGFEIIDCCYWIKTIPKVPFEWKD